MRKIPLSIVSHIALTALAFLALAGCLKPVDLDVFKKNEKVKEILAREDDGGELDPFRDTSIEMELQIGSNKFPLAMDDTVTVSLSGSPSSAIIRVTNETTNGIEWLYNNTSLGTASQITVNSANAPFNSTGAYYVTVIASISGVPESSAVVIVIVN